MQYHSDFVNLLNAKSQNYDISSLRSKYAFVQKETAWYFEDDEKNFKAYDPLSTNIIQSNFESGVSKFNLRIGDQDYEMNFKESTQINKSTGHKRHFGTEIPLKCEYSYFWEIFDFDKYSNPTIINGKSYGNFSVQNNQKIENSRSNGVKEFQMSISGATNQDTVKKYIFNLEKMTQTSIDQNFTRNLLRIQNEVIKVEIEQDRIMDFRNVIIYGLDVEGARKDLIKLDSISKVSKKIKGILPNHILQGICQNVEYKLENGFIVLDGYLDYVGEAKEKIRDILEESYDIVTYPPTWSCQKDFEITVLDPMSQEFLMVQSEIAKTLKCKIFKIERIENQKLWEHYRNTLTYLSNPTEKLLFHGTRDNPPEKIYKNKQNGFDLRFCNAGMWGKGTYFAVNASYSNNYAYTSGTSKQMFLARVAVGDSIKMNNDQSIKMPPFKQNPKYFEERYDSIEGNTGGSDIFIVYENKQAYPSYLITYE
jgi:hypothetical protein